MWLTRFALFTTLLFISKVLATGGPTCLSFTPTPYALATQEMPLTIWIDSSDWPGVHHATLDLQDDLEIVTGFRPVVRNITMSAGTIDDLPGAPDSVGTIPIVIGTLGRSDLLKLAIQLSPDVDRKCRSIQGNLGADISEVINKFVPGIGTAYAIVGSDKQGTIYGIYDLLNQAGVSPWYVGNVPLAGYSHLSEGGPRSLSNCTQRYMRSPM